VVKARPDKREGMGVLEMLILGPHRKSWFKDFLDMHA